MRNNSEKQKSEVKEDDYGMYTAMHQSLRLSPLERILRFVAERKSQNAVLQMPGEQEEKPH